MNRTSEPYRAHNLANRARRIPRRIRELLTTIRAVQTRIDEIERIEPDDMSDTIKSAFIRKLRDEAGPANYQVRCLVDRGQQLGIPAQLLNA